MIPRRARPLLTGLLLPLLLLAVNCPPAAAKSGDASFYSWPRPDPAIAPGTLLRYQPMALPAFYRARAWRILYVTRDFAGRPIISSGMVVMSAYADKIPSRREIVAYAHPTTGVARKCAPTVRQKPTEAIIGLAQLIRGRYIIAASDYPGLGTPGPVGYLVGLGQGRAVIDSVRAARRIPDVRGGTRFALWGFSQGGHAALFAADQAKTYAPELSLVGVAATAPPTDLRALLYASIETVPGRILTAMTLWSWSGKYGAPLAPLVDADVAKVVRSVSSNCVDDLGGKLDVLAAQRPLKQRFLSADPGRTPPWNELLRANSMFHLPAGVAAFLAQGGADTIVRPETTHRLAEASCRAGNRVKYLALPGAGHTRSAGLAVEDAMAWIADRFAGAPAPSTCRWSPRPPHD